MAKTFVAADGGSNNYSISDALNSAIKGTRLTGYAGEIGAELAKRHGDNGLHIPLQAIMQSKATGSTALIPGAVPLNGYSLEAGIAEIDAAVKRELLATKFGVSARSTDQAEYRIPTVDSRPTAVIVDVDQAITDQGGSTFDYVSIKPVTAGSLIEIANSLDFSNPDAVQVVTRQISDVVTEAIDAAFLNGYGPTGAGLSFPGLAAVATASGVGPLSNTSTVAQWADVVESYSSYTGTTDTSGTRWLLHPRVTDALLPISPIFTGAQTAIGMGGGISTLLGHPVIKGRLPVTAGVPDVVQSYYGEPGEIFMVLFNSASISLVANPYEANAFAKGSTLLRVMISFGMGVRDAKRLVKATTQLP
jgi:HK97 family phage major capsid protein